MLELHWVRWNALRGQCVAQTGLELVCQDALTAWCLLWVFG